MQELPYNGGEGKNFQSLLFLLPGAGIGAGSNEANSEAGNPQRAARAAKQSCIVSHALEVPIELELRVRVDQPQLTPVS